MLWVTLFIIAPSIVVLNARTFVVMHRDDPGPRPMRELYDTRRPE